ncbi:MAG TPA: dihydroxyacetone kinase subunit DhaL [Pseudogracilibacillus sp.]|nr:dihydroxyacetone kinase subunit DhaL [Pseudogracilibacillus sp.]
MIFTVDDTIRWLHKTSAKMTEQVDYLTVLDDMIGDGDHGLNMVRGFQAIVNDLAVIENNEARLTVADLLKRSSQQLLKSVGGASGILYATAFYKMATVFQTTARINHLAFEKALAEAVKGIKRRGNVNSGEKTLLDVWVAMLTLFEESDKFPESEIIEQTARTAMENTKTYAATKGKAALYEEASLGHIDPGAASTYYLFASLAETCKENEDG